MSPLRVEEPKSGDPLREPPAPVRCRGRVQHIYPDRGFGFIRCIEAPLREDIGDDFFFHQTSLEMPIEALEEGELVLFKPTYGAKGKRAVEIERLGYGAE